MPSFSYLSFQHTQDQCWPDELGKVELYAQNSEKEKWIHVSKSQTINPIPWVVMATFGLWNPKWPGFSQPQFLIPSQLFCHFVFYISYQREFNCCSLALSDTFSLSPTVIFQRSSNIFSTCTGVSLGELISLWFSEYQLCFKPRESEFLPCHSWLQLEKRRTWISSSNTWGKKAFA